VACEEKHPNMNIVSILILYGARVALLRKKKLNFLFLDNMIKQFELNVCSQ
jgi:hypothetical protein